MRVKATKRTDPDLRTIDYDMELHTDGRDYELTIPYHELGELRVLLDYIVSQMPTTMDVVTRG